MPNLRNLDQNEEKVVVEHVLNLVTRGFPPRLADVADMANSLRAERNLDPVGTRWPNMFIKRYNKLIIKFNYKYNYKRALYKDSRLIQSQFNLVANTKAKYSIQDNDIYNFNKVGFIIDQISTKVVVIALERRGQPKLV